MYRKGTYYAIVKIERQLDTEFHLLETPTKSAWVNMQSQENPRFAKLEAEQISMHQSLSRGIKGLKFKVPSFEELRPAVEVERVMAYAIDELAFKEVSLSDKRQIKRPSLIRKKLLVRR